ncbi:hypothetical protein KDW_30740 [Dictyobacter vulcani]|uniref:Uncharacterized protein n=1 Tax=Dictyobacter vulcani TaxID=2607529 RepID=A0A5J4KP33_9CHLR|nr:hypothetical protein [Dictyobacter vulcani]GER88912.1 hypothetical protein KDW_30740 [Dictyobacter vulcani]
MQDTHSRHGELIHANTPYTYERLSTALKALSSINSLKAVKAVVNNESVHTMPANTLAELIESDILAHNGDDFMLNPSCPAEALKVIYSILEHTDNPQDTGRSDAVLKVKSLLTSNQ